MVRVTSTGFSAEADFLRTTDATLPTGLALFVATFAFGIDFETAFRATGVFTTPFFIVDFTFATAFTFDLDFVFALIAMIHFLQTKIETPSASHLGTVAQTTRAFFHAET
jgi:hypothetical protein